jgi:uncharacterized protein (TIGR02147 family)
MNMQHESARDWLYQEYQNRKRNNNSFSLRAFARLLQIPASRLCDILSGKRPITAMTGTKIVERLKYPPSQRRQFMNCVTRDYKKFRSIDESNDETLTTWEKNQLPADIYLAISDWYHFTILSLMETKGFKYDQKWIASRLGISGTEVKIALDRLERLGLIQTENGKLKSFRTDLTTTHEIKSDALRSGHRQMIGKAVDSLDSADLHLRDVTAMTMAIDPKKLTEAKLMIKNFRRKLCKFLESGERKEVYALCLQLFPLSKEEMEK